MPRDRWYRSVQSRLDATGFSGPRVAHRRRRVGKRSIASADAAHPRPANVPAARSPPGAGRAARGAPGGHGGGGRGSVRGRHVPDALCRGGRSLSLEGPPGLERRGAGPPPGATGDPGLDPARRVGNGRLLRARTAPRRVSRAVVLRVDGLAPRARARARAARAGHCRRVAMGANRLWLHTCTLDGPAALPNYRARGFVPFRTEHYETELPGAP